MQQEQAVTVEPAVEVEPEVTNVPAIQEQVEPVEHQHAPVVRVEVPEGTEEIRVLMVQMV